MKTIFALLLLSITLGANLSLAHQRTDIAEKASEVWPLAIGETIPDVTLFDAKGKPFSLLEEASKQPTILLFYRGGWCPFCNAQLSQLQNIGPQMSKLGYKVIAISPDTPDQLAKASEGKELAYQLASDFNFAATRQFGLGFYIPKSYSDKVMSIGGETRAVEGDSRSVLPVPAAFVLNQKGRIEFEYINPNYRVRITPELLLTAAELALSSKND